MKKRIVILILTILALAGCKANANIAIDYNGKVKEEIKISFDNSEAVNFKNPTLYAKSYINYYKSSLDLKKYSYIINENKSDTDIIFSKSSDNVCDGIKYGLFQQNLYNSFECVEDDYYYVVKSVGEQLISKPLSQKKFNIENVALNITSPVVLEENNADKTDGNTYTWYFDENTSSDKSIYIKISKDALNQKKSETIAKAESKKKKDRIIEIAKTILVIAVVFGGIMFIILKFYAKYKNNKIEYQ